MDKQQTVIRLIGDMAEERNGIEAVCAMIGATLNDAKGIPVRLEKIHRQGLVIHYDGESATIGYWQVSQLLRAIGLLVEAMRAGQQLYLQEDMQFDTIGAMVDCSRNAVPKVETIKELLRRMALMGMNMLMLYTEDIYEVAAKPYFGYMRGRYTAEELRQCDDYAAMLGIEMVPCIQTLAHLENYLRWEVAADLKDTHEVLLTGQPQTYAFIDEMVSSVSSCFRSKRIHIGMDEAHGLGRGKSLDLYGNVNRFELMNAHLKKVVDITESHGLKPMIWSDMYFRMGSKTHDYYDLDTEIDEAHMAQMPKGVDLVYWDYYHNEQSFYSRMIEKHQALGSTPLFAGGIWTWLGMCTHYSKTLAYSEAALLACKQAGVKEAFITMWGDNGAENNLWSILPGLQLYAEHAYAATVDLSNLEKRIAFCAGISLQDHLSIEQLDAIHGLVLEEYGLSNAAKYLLWQDPLLGLFDKHIEGIATENHYRKLAEKYETLASKDASHERLFATLARLGRVLQLKADLGVRIREAYLNNQLAELRRIAIEELPELISRTDQLRTVHRQQWMSINKPNGWEIQDIRYGGILARLSSAKERLLDYVTGTIPLIEELQEARLYVDNREGRERPKTNYYVSYELISSASRHF